MGLLQLDLLGWMLLLNGLLGDGPAGRVLLEELEDVALGVRGSGPGVGGGRVVGGGQCEGRQGHFSDYRL